MRYLAAGIFFVALLMNVKFTLDSPYFLTGNELGAQTTGTGTGTSTGTETGTGTTPPPPNGKYQASMSITYTQGDRFSADANISTSFWKLVTASGGVGYEKEITKTVTVNDLRCCADGDPRTDYCSPYYPPCP